jgi:hypothetical protein
LMLATVDCSPAMVRYGIDFTMLDPDPGIDANHRADETRYWSSH